MREPGADLPRLAEELRLLTQNYQLITQNYQNALKYAELELEAFEEGRIDVDEAPPAPVTRSRNQ